MPPVARQSTEADIDALDKLCERLAGFDTDLSVEWVDGFLAALVASRRLVPPSEWMPVLFGDAFGRAFADPQDVQQAMATLMARWNVLASQLDAEALVDAPDDLRLTPLMLHYDDELRAEVVAGGHVPEAEAQDLLQTGNVWAEGFHTAVQAFEADWPEPDVETEEGRWYDHCLTRVAALMLPQAALAEHLAAEYPDETLTRDQLVDEACFAVQDLRVYWLDHAPKPETRRVAPAPGRNDPCPCGSGKKFKKCHGA